MLHLRRTIVLVVLAGLPMLAHGSAPVISEGERWAAVGDSITHNGEYQSFIRLYYLTRRPGMRFTTLNCGINGDTARGALARFDWDVAPHAPTLVTVLLGMNDLGSGLFMPSGPTDAQARRLWMEAYREAMRALVRRARETGARVVILSPSCYDETAAGEAMKPALGVDRGLAEGSAFCASLARETGCAFVDLFGPMSRLTEEGQARDPHFSLISADRVHPAEPGHFVMAALFLRQMGEDGEVASLCIDAAAQADAGSTRCTLGSLRSDARGLSFTCLERSLPFPVSQADAGAAERVDFESTLNREYLRVSHLPPGAYALRIDGAPQGTFSAADLSGGVNLATLASAPQVIQAARVARAEHRRFELGCRLRVLAQMRQYMAANALPTDGGPSADAAFEGRLAGLRRDGYRYADALAAIYTSYREVRGRETAIRAEMDQDEAQSYAEAIPVAHRFELTPEGADAPVTAPKPL